MRAFWITVEKLDDLAFGALDMLDKKLARNSYRQRTEKAIEHVRAPQKAIRFDN